MIYSERINLTLNKTKHRELSLLFLPLFFLILFLRAKHAFLPTAAVEGNAEFEATEGHELELNLENIDCPRSHLKIRRHYDVELSVGLFSSKGSREKQFTFPRVGKKNKSPTGQNQVFSRLILVLYHGSGRNSDLGLEGE